MCTVDHFRWLRSPHALLYDPAMRKTLNNLMKKLFIQVFQWKVNCAVQSVVGSGMKSYVCFPACG